MVTDDGNPPLSVTNAFTVEVLEVNSPPVLPNQPDRTMAGLAQLVVTNTASDPDWPHNAITYSLVAGPTNAFINANGIITWTPVMDQVPSQHTFTTVATDANGWATKTPSLTVTNSFEVVVLAIHRGPVLPVQSSQVIYGTNTLVVYNTAFYSDIPPSVLSYTLTAAPTNAVIDGSGVITWTPDLAQVPGSYLFETVVSDSAVSPISSTNSFLVQVLPEPAADVPVILSLSLTTETATITWKSLANRTYRLQYRADLNSGDWLDESPDVVGTGTTTVSAVYRGEALHRFYRVILLP